MTVMDPRVAERRKSVSEDRARKRLRWILIVIAVISLAIGTLWLVRSPILSIRQVDVVGAEVSDPRGAMSGLGMDVGTPTIDVSGAAITSAILKDPWVESATVRVKWPGSVTIEVTERIPVAPVLAGEQWVLVSRDGGVIMAVGNPSGDDALVAIDQGSIAPGSLITDAMVLGALEFIEYLPIEHRSGVRVRTEGEGLVADVQGHRIRLGRPVDMAQKAAVLAALLDSELPEEATIDLIAPLRPGVANPRPQVEPEE
jgi:cell division protein FtsQ